MSDQHSQLTRADEIDNPLCWPACCIAAPHCYWPLVHLATERGNFDSSHQPGSRFSSHGDTFYGSLVNKTVRAEIIAIAAIEVPDKRRVMPTHVRVDR